MCAWLLTVVGIAFFSLAGLVPDNMCAKQSQVIVQGYLKSCAVPTKMRSQCGCSLDLHILQKKIMFSVEACSLGRSSCRLNWLRRKQSERMRLRALQRLWRR